MKLELLSLSVQNFGPLRDVCIHFDRDGKTQPVTVLGGANGSGKTTALELIAALGELLGIERRVSPILRRAQFAKAVFAIDGAPLPVAYGALPGDVPSQHVAVVKNPVHSNSWSVATNGSMPETIANLIGRQRDWTLAAASDKGLVPGEPFMPSILYFPHQRAVREVSGSEIHREMVSYEWVYRYRDSPEFPGSLASYLIWLEYAEPDAFRQVCEFLAQLDLDGKSFGIERKLLRATVRTRDGHVHDLAHLSSGEQNLLIMLLELRRRLLPHSIVLIDEIENSLHPAFQYRLAQSLLKLQQMVPFQLIVTTHAPAFVEIFGPESARILTEF